MAETVQGLQQLDARLNAISGLKVGSPILRRLALSTVREAKLLVPRRTDNLGRSIHVASVTATTAEVAAGARYASYVEYGTRAHEITPRAKLALRFAASAGGARLTGTPRTGAAVVFAKRVHHPGTRAQPFLLKGAERAVSSAGLADKVIAAWNDAG